MIVVKADFSTDCDRESKIRIDRSSIDESEKKIESPIIGWVIFVSWRLSPIGPYFKVEIIFLVLFSICFSMTPDDKKDLIMLSLDRRTKRKIVVFLLFVLCQVGKEEEEDEEEDAKMQRSRDQNKKMKQERQREKKKKNKVSFFNLKRRWKKQCESLHSKLSGDFELQGWIQMHLSLSESIFAYTWTYERVDVYVSNASTTERKSK